MKEYLEYLLDNARGCRIDVFIDNELVGSANNAEKLVAKAAKATNFFTVNDYAYYYNETAEFLYGC